MQKEEPGPVVGLKGETQTVCPIMELKEIGIESAAVLATLHYAVFAGKEHWDEGAFQQILGMPGVRAWVLCAGEAYEDTAQEGASRNPVPVGFIICRYVMDEGEILSLGVHPYWRRRGVGRHLLGHVVRQARHAGVTLFLEVRFSNQAAAMLYMDMGFQQVGIRPRYYEDGEDARLLKLGS